ncbi:sensor histidine kinase [Bacillus suaedae]|uniref:Sensor histidine kinase n=1 Tax=Halalkalibacter suaedae TaxID=2822140 RepID=A0A940WSE2_9BACI|nr:sensor histidine kinase [Bacillus suaedae]MBP3951436.1 sensor histidine kinase [Bacillus suaedae]
MKKRLARLQWQFIRHNVVATFLISFFILFLITYQDKRGLLLVIDLKLAGIPLLFWFLGVIIITGMISGYIQAVPLRRRIEQLVHAAARFERGSFSHHVVIEGDDEVTELAERMNRMAKNIEEQVASLQRLSAERAEMQDTVRKAAVTEERQRLARDLHDAVSQQLFAISMMTAATKLQLEERKDPATEQMAMVENMANLAQAEMRALLLHLRPAHLEGKNLKEGLQHLFNEMHKKYDISVQIHYEEDVFIPKGIEDQLFRMVQEAISNVLRHAKATQLEFQLKQTPQELKVKVIDDGIGFHENDLSQSSYGLETMRERMNEIGGTLHIVSVPNKGTQIEANIPITWGKNNDPNSTR